MHKQIKELKLKGEFDSEILRDIYAPKNINQIKLIQHRERATKEISGDQIYNAYQISLTLDEFVKDFQLLPEVLIIFSE